MRWTLIAFDLYGTLLDVSGLASRLAPFVGPQAADLLASWRNRQLERTWTLAYEPFDAVTAHALEDVAPQLAPGVREKMSATWLTLPAHPDAAEALRKLGHAGIRRAVLSNGTAAMIRSAVDAAGLPIDEIRSADEVKAYKTDHRVYALVPKGTTLFVSGNAWDADGAKKYGHDVAFIDRGGPAPTLAPNVRVRSLTELAAAVIG
ncbi:MAG: haloacid dehalogenase type II [Myxococcales bacterium]